MEISRAGFLKGLFSAFSTCACGGRIFAAPPGWAPPKNPRLAFGAVSDTHLRTSANGKGRGKYWPDKYLVAAFKYFRELNLDAVVNCGDMAHRGQVLEQEFHAAAWRKVFPDNRAPDGHVVEKLFVNGNHDVEGSRYGDFVEKAFPDPAERAKHVLSTDMAANWQRIWGEPYAPVWHKTVKGFHFFGRHFGVDEMELARLIRAKGKECGLQSGKDPFFILSHVRPHKNLNRSLRPFRKAIGFFGHWHQSAANWNNIYFWSSFPSIEIPSCEPRGCSAPGAEKGFAQGALEGKEGLGKGHQGYVVRVYDDQIVISRREFGEGEGSLGADWIMPLGTYEPHPLSKDELKKRIGEPQFRDGANLVVAEATTPPPPDRPEKTGKPALRVDIPLADANPGTRVYAYDVVVAGAEDSPKLCKSVYAVGGNMAVGHEPNGGVTTLFLPKAQLPKGERLVVAVRPITSLGTAGKPIICTCDRNARQSGA